MNAGATLYDAIERMSWQTLAPVLLNALASPSHAPVVVMGVARVGDPGATRTVYATVVVLALLGIVLATLALWVFRRTRPEPELLAPLETMHTRSWRKLDPAAQRRSLDESRPADAAPLRREASEPAVDSSFAKVAPVSSFDDLSDGASGDEKVIDLEGDADDLVGPDVVEVVDAASPDELDVDDTHDQRNADAQTVQDELASAEPEIGDDTGEISNDAEFDMDIGLDDASESDSSVGGGAGGLAPPTGRHIDPLLLKKKP